VRHATACTHCETHICAKPCVLRSTYSINHAAKSTTCPSLYWFEYQASMCGSRTVFLDTLAQGGVLTFSLGHQDASALSDSTNSVLRYHVLLATHTKISGGPHLHDSSFCSCDQWLGEGGSRHAVSSERHVTSAHLSTSLPRQALCDVL